MDLISIIVPAYNAEKFIGNTIDSVLNQTYKNFELIIVNDNSKDNTIKIIKEYDDKRIKLVESDINHGAAMSRNIGIKKASGRYITFIDADDYWVNDKLEKQIDFMNTMHCAFSFTGYEFADCDLNLTGKKVIVPISLNYKQALRNTTIFTSTVMFDTAIISKDDIQFPLVKSEDTALWFNILKKGYKAYGLNEILSYYRRSANTLSSNKLQAIKRMWNLYRKQQGLSLIYSAYNFIFYAINAVKRRI